LLISIAAGQLHQFIITTLEVTFDDTTVSSFGTLAFQQVDNLNVRYGSIQGTNGISFEVREGETVALIACLSPPLPASQNQKKIIHCAKWGPNCSQIIFILFNASESDSRLKPGAFFLNLVEQQKQSLRFTSQARYSPTGSFVVKKI
jgi:hypothetical protein